jgi:hypothetical protein
LFYSLLHDYSIGGKFLKILQEIYTENQIFVKLSDGLLQPFTTTTGVKQGCVFSPTLFNLFINKICEIFDESCKPVKINNVNVSCLLWADDLLLFSETAEGLQNAINKMNNFYEKLDLKINIKKTKIIIFNKSGRTLKNKFNFTLNGQNLEITDQYQYLGIKLRPSGGLNFAVQELHDKASRAWFGISNIIYKNKRMETDKVFGIFDSLVTPVATYGCEFWLPYVITKHGFTLLDKLINSWENYKCETINQRCCRTILSVHKKTSRLAVLGELGRYPLFIKSLSHCLNYKLSLLKRKSPSNLLGHVLTEMGEMLDRGQDCWLTRIDKIGKFLKIPENLRFNDSSGKTITKILRSKFDRFWLEKINETKTIGSDVTDHNKLRVYNQFKSSFTKEPYIEQVRNRNQRCFITRLRVSAHHLGIEKGRKTRPVTPIEKRICDYCKPNPSSDQTRPTNQQTHVDTEFHFVTQCDCFNIARNCFYGKMSSIIPGFMNLSNEQKFSTLMCPISPKAAKVFNRFLKSMFSARDKLDSGENIGEV